MRTRINDRLENYVRCALVACVGLALAAAGASGQTTALYDAENGAVAWDPVSIWGWTPHNIGPGTNHQGIPIVNDSGTGLNAWGIDVGVASPANPFYSQCIDPTEIGCSDGVIRNAAVQYGWRYSARARFVNDYGAAASMGLSLWIDNRGYFVLFDLDGNNLRAILLNSPNSDATIALPSGGTGATGYHDIALVYRPASQSVAFEFDGIVRGITTGEGQTHDNAMLWGNLTLNSKGQMNFHRVEFQVLLPGDYNRNGLVDAADYTLWRNSLGSNLAAADGNDSGTVDATDYTIWKTHFGMRSVLDFGSAGGTAAPEPTGFVLSFVSMASIFSLLRRRVTSPPSAN